VTTDAMELTTCTDLTECSRTWRWRSLRWYLATEWSNWRRARLQSFVTASRIYRRSTSFPNWHRTIRRRPTRHVDTSVNSTASVN